MPAYETLEVSRDDAIGAVTIDRPAGMNTLTPTMVEELLDVAVRFSEDDDVRCVTLTGAGEAFGAGADLSRLEGERSDAIALRRLASTLHDAIIQFYQGDTPLVTGVNGIAAGAGFSLAILGDIVLVSDAARFEYAYHRVGLTGDGGSTFFLPRMVGLRQAKEIVLRDEPIDPNRAVELGLATEVVPADELQSRVAAEAERIASGPTAVYGRMRRLLTESFDRDLAGQLAAETDAIAESTRTRDYTRGYAAFFDDEPAEFVGK